jgi:hypothetical protein
MNPIANLSGGVSNHSENHYCVYTHYPTSYFLATSTNHVYKVLGIMTLVVGAILDGYDKVLTW